MGKKLIFKDADFSVNAIEAGSDWLDITNLFTTWTNQKPYSVTSGDTITGTSIYFKGCAAVDISAYAGRKMRVAFVAFTTSGGAISNFGHIVKDANNTKLEALAFPMNGAAGSMRTYYYDYNIPSSANYFCASYPTNSKITEIGGLPFACYVENV